MNSHFNEQKRASKQLSEDVLENNLKGSWED